jgi:hypothetical protein
MAIIHVSAPSINHQKNQSLFLDQLFNHPDWRSSRLSPISEKDLKERSIELVEDSREHPFCFQLCWQLKDGKTLLAPFWADVSLGKWCFQNGNPHSFLCLSEMIPQILHHLEKGETLVHKSQSRS